MVEEETRLKLTNFVHARVDNYINWQKSSDWDENYKWQILPKLRDDLSVFSEANEENVSDIIAIYKRCNPSSGSFIRYTYFDDFEKILNDKPSAVRFINSIWSGSFEDANLEYRKYSYNGRSLGTPGIGYLAAGRNPNVWPLFRGELYDGIVSTLNLHPQTKNNSDKYRIYSEIISAVSSELVSILHERGYDEKFTSLSVLCGQDFLCQNFFGWSDNRLLHSISQFIKQADGNIGKSVQEADLTVRQYKLQFMGLPVSASFGQGGIALVPWMSIGFGSSFGFSPTIFYYPEYKRLILAFDHIKNDTPKYQWQDIDKFKTITEYFAELGMHDDYIRKYGDSRVFKSYDTNIELPKSLMSDIKSILAIYKKQTAKIEAGGIPVALKEDVLTKEQDGSSTETLAKNTILYGPPGTGKTWQARNVYAKELLNSQVGKEISADEVLSESLKDLRWWQVIAVCLYYSDRPLKVAELSEQMIVASYAKYIRQRINDIIPTLWTTLQERSTLSSSSIANRIDGIEYFHKNNMSEWSLSEAGRDYVASNLSGVPITAESRKSENWQRFYRMVTFHQSYSYEEFVEGIRPKLDGDDGALSYEMKVGVFKELCITAAGDPDNKYLIIIDEINRGNIAKIFGELITLLEDDKRGSMSVTLPCSQETFTVPDNLYVIGTMNTADRSIALLDIALRRRFEFVEVMPNYDLVGINREVAGVNLAKLLKSINDKISVLIDRDHQIGHSYFMKVDDKISLHRVWYKKVLPLIQEYFYNDWERLKTLLGSNIIQETQVKFPAGVDIDDSILYDFKEFSPDELPLLLVKLIDNEEISKINSL